MRRGGFTLIEVMIVVALLGLLAGATAFSMADSVGRASRAEVIGKLRHTDSMARAAASRLGEPCVLEFDLAEQSLRRISSDGKGSERLAGHVLHVQELYRIDRVVMPLSAAPNQERLGGGSVFANVDHGKARVFVSASGRSVSYAVRLMTKNEATDGSREEAWVLFSGLTGQMTRMKNEEEVEQLFTALASGRPDAD